MLDALEHGTKALLDEIRRSIPPAQSTVVSAIACDIIGRTCHPLRLWTPSDADSGPMWSVRLLALGSR
jgi:hypothetical protein